MKEIWQRVPRVDQGLAVMEDRLKGLVDDEHGALREILSSLFERKGKRLRGGLCLLCGELSPGHEEDLIQGAMALEMLHLATLIHDDIVDNSNLRRGIPSLHRLFGIREALLTGDYLFSKSLIYMSKLLKQSEGISMARGVMHICQQEINQSLNRGADWSFKNYRRRAAGKTAALFTLALQCGSTLSHLDTGSAQNLRRYGFFLGVAFQMADDLLDLRGTPGKPAFQDYKEGLVNLPLLLAVMNNPKDKKRAEGMLARGQFRRVYKMVQHWNGEEKALEMAREYQKRSQEQLVDFPSGPVKHCLNQLAGFCVERSY